MAGSIRLERRGEEKQTCRLKAALTQMRGYVLPELRSQGASGAGKDRIPPTRHRHLGLEALTAIHDGAEASLRKLMFLAFYLLRLRSGQPEDRYGFGK